MATSTPLTADSADRSIVLIEDDADLAFVIERNLGAEGYNCIVARDGEAGVEAVIRHVPSLVVLDLMLPKRDGFRVLAGLRAAGVETPVLILTARRQERDKLEGFRLGADDYLTKPFSMAELVARLDVLWRRARRWPRSTPHDVTGRVHVGDLDVDVIAHTVRHRGRDVTLAPKAFDLLVALMRRPGEVVPREELLRQVWGYASDVSSRTLDTHIGDLRRVLEVDPSEPKLILTVWRVGYRLAIDAGA